MRQKRVTEQKPGIRKAQSKEPMAEGIQKKRRKQRNWVSMTDKELVFYAKTYIEENGIKSRKDLEKADLGLYIILRKRILLDALIPKKREAKDRRNWSSMSDGELISFAKNFMKENKIKNRQSLTEADSGLHYILKKRNLLDTIIVNTVRNWSSISDKEIIFRARKIIKEKEIKKRSILEKADKSLYEVLRRRNLLDAVIPEKRRNWSSIPDKEVLSYAKKFIEENAIKNITGLIKADLGLYKVLWKRKLLDAVIPEKQEHRDWRSMTDEELISFVRKIIEEKSIKTRSVLAKADIGLYEVLRRRNLLDAVFADTVLRNWSSMTDEEFVSYAKTYIKENGIKIRIGLKKADGGLYDTLRRRKLLDAVIPNKQKRRKSRKWHLMSDEELISFVRKIIEEKGIKTRKGLDKADGGLYYVLRKRNLLSAVFSDIEQAKKIAAVKQVVDAMKEF